jgi:hypothetical protein
VAIRRELWIEGCNYLKNTRRTSYDVSNEGASLQGPLLETSNFSLYFSGSCIPITVDAMEVLIKYCTNSFPQVDQFI